MTSDDVLEIRRVMTRDGSTPTSTSEEYLAPLQISQNTQLRAVAFKGGMLLKRRSSTVGRLKHFVESPLVFTARAFLR